MKLVFCTECHDVFKLVTEHPYRTCMCGKSVALLKPDSLHAEISGTCVPLGFSNPSLAKAVRNQPERGQGEEFIAFVIPENCPTVKRVKSIKARAGDTQTTRSKCSLRGKPRERRSHE